MDPCALLTEEELSQYGDYKEPSPEEVLVARACDFPRAFYSEDSGPIVGLVIQHDRGVDDFRELGSGVTRGQLDSGREFVRESGDERGKDCTMALAVGAQTRIDIAVSGADEDAGCAVAAELAELVDPRLPQG